MRRLASRVLLAVLLLATSTSVALADPNTSVDTGINNPGVRIGEWITRNVTALFAPLIAAVALYYLAKREFTKFISFAVFSVVAALFIFAGAEFKDSAVGLAKWVIGR